MQTVEFGAAILAVFVLIGFLVVIAVVARKPEGIDADAARAYYDEHGHWPDQTPEEAEAERRELARVYAPSEPDDQGYV